MLTVLSCIAYEHNLFYLACAVGILAVGSFLTMRLYARVRRSSGTLKFLWLYLSGVIAGGTVWSTHFVAMVAYNNPFVVGYDISLTGLSLLIVVAGAILGLYLASATKRSILIEVGGLVFGASIAVMHFTGVAAMKVSGAISMSAPFEIAAVVFACVFSIAAISSIARPIPFMGKHSAALFFVVAVASLHFTAMAGLQIQPFNLDVDNSNLISNRSVGLIVVVVMSVLMVSAMVTYSIDSMNAQTADKRINHLAHHDPLTGLSNRVGLSLYLEGVLNRAVSMSSRICVVSVKLNRLSEVNEVWGHAAGDALLRTVAKNVSEKIAAIDHFARIGGDEFIIVGKPGYHTIEFIRLCKRLQKAFAQPVEWQGDTIQVGSNIGYAIYPDDASSAPKLVLAAERAMRRAKQTAQPVPTRYDSDTDQQTRERGILALELRTAVNNNEFELFYQLQNDVQTRVVTGTEALLRWNHPKRGLVSPGKFIDVATETGMIGEIGAWVIRRACEEAASWPNQLKVAVNVAPVQLADDDFPDVVAEALAISGLTPSRLEIEITETGIIADVSHALQVIHKLKRLGIRVAMDDFGTGYSSLATLQTFPFDKIKIDREFIKDLGNNPQSEAIIRSTIILSKSLGMPVLAEGVETEEQLSFLASLGCDEVQGFLFGKPVNAGDLKIMMLSESPNHMPPLSISDAAAMAERTANIALHPAVRSKSQVA